MATEPQKSCFERPPWDNRSGKDCDATTAAGLAIVHSDLLHMMEDKPHP